MSSHEDGQLGQFIPLHYHFQMLADETRMAAFESALEKVVPLGGRVLELGSGTGVQSFFAARRAAHVMAVEFNPVLVRASRRFLSDNGVGDRVTVVQGDAATFTPEAPVDVVICEMLHSALLREKQIEVIARFKAGYTARFGDLPRFVPEATVLAAQPVQQDYDFHGYRAPVPFFQAASIDAPGTTPICDPQTYAVIDYARTLPERFDASLRFHAMREGDLNAVRFITKNLLAILPEEHRSIDWHNQYLVLPLPAPFAVSAGDAVDICFTYAPGASLDALCESLHAQRVDQSTHVGQRSA